MTLKAINKALATDGYPYRVVPAGNEHGAWERVLRLNHKAPKYQAIITNATGAHVADFLSALCFSYTLSKVMTKLNLLHWNAIEAGFKFE